MTGGAAGVVAGPLAARGPERTWLTYYCRLLAGATLLLVAAGGMVTSTNSGLSVPDWPTTYGYSMFTFPLDKMVGGIYYEHGHRLIASMVGLFTIVLVVWQWRAEPRAWVRRLGGIALAAVIVQGILGGLTVIYLLPAPISIGHAGLAQIFFCLTIVIALVTSRSWHAPVHVPIDDARLRHRLVVLAGAVYLQILAGATMRHLGAGLAIPDFPLSFGQLIPPAWTTGIAIHFVHRLGAVLVSALVVMTVWYVRTRYGARRELMRPAWLLLGAVAVQVTLGALVILSRKSPVINTAHVATGAVVLGTSVLLAVRGYRVRCSDPLVAP